jgi:hypothetical protein
MGEAWRWNLIQGIWRLVNTTPHWRIAPCLRPVHLLVLQMSWMPSAYLQAAGVPCWVYFPLEDTVYSNDDNLISYKDVGEVLCSLKGSVKVINRVEPTSSASTVLVAWTYAQHNIHRIPRSLWSRLLCVGVPLHSAAPSSWACCLCTRGHVIVIHSVSKV